MMFIDPHIHMNARTTDDYEAMAAAGVQVVVEPAFWMGQPRTHVGTFEDYYLALLGWERFRARQHGMWHFCTLALNPKEANDPVVADGVLGLLPRYLEKEGVLAVGEVGYDDITPAEERVFAAQVQMAADAGLPVLVHTPHRDKVRGTHRTLDLLRELAFPLDRVLVDHNTEETIEATLDAGCWAGHSIYPETKMSEPRMVALVQRYGAERMVINSAADWGRSDPLKVPKTAVAMLEAGIPRADVERIVWGNPLAFFALSGRFDPASVEAPPRIDQRELFADNSVLRGQTPRVDG